MITLEEIFDQAKKDTRSAKLINNGYQSVSLYDVKIIKDDYTHKVEILNTSKRYYEPVTPYDLETFETYGWRCGVYAVTLSNYYRKLDDIETKIRAEVNGKNSEKLVRELKTKRITFMSQYTQLNKQLNDSKKNTDNI